MSVSTRTECLPNIVTFNASKKELLTFDNLKNAAEEYGIKFRNDAVVRIHRWSDYHYPKESVVTDGVVNEAIYTIEQKSCGDIKEHKNFQYLYPYGCTFDVDKSSIILLSTGTACFPFNRPTCDVELNTADVLCPDVTDYNPLPDIGKLAEVPYSCLQENEEILSKSATILKAQLHQFDNRCVAKVLSTYKELGMVPEKLQIIKPKFETPLPELKASVIPPRFRGIPNPALELMDLDDFSYRQMQNWINLAINAATVIWNII
ncbi:intraflagellar transport protein 52 homolog [Caerostris extrusa]|uniref:Intraflagellar transport protein 52 homolog n=1 Tax=Caerostris extrusa TaxID=172846 RepID=A0AAV4RPS8_CAEEX|nr:intraflagellar transport protein 52 homolog [Caerostris extrusa]